MKKITKGKRESYYCLVYVEATIENNCLELKEIKGAVYCPHIPKHFNNYCCCSHQDIYGREEIEELDYRCAYAHIEEIDNPDKENLSQKKIKVLMCKNWIIGGLI
jgi:hypothetical protein